MGVKQRKTRRLLTDQVVRATVWRVVLLVRGKPAKGYFGGRWSMQV